MYQTRNNNFFHGIMFHHFHDDKFHTRGQGSISKDDFYRIIKFIGKKNILDAQVFFEKFKENKLLSNEVCFTFDDSIKCQVDIALPILEDLKIKSFFFIYTSIFENKPDNLEIFRYFRMNYFKNVEDFYKDFYKTLDKDLNFFFKKNEEEIRKKKIKHPNYSTEDVKFRLVRDIFLQKEEYEKIMFQMIDEKKFDYKKLYSNLFFSKSDLINLDKLGHHVGLHSHNHHMLLEKLSYDDQKYEYEKCQSTLCKILNKSPDEMNVMSHPCGSYNNDTLQILKNLGIEMGFKQIMTIEPEKGMKQINNSNLEIARQNHSAIFRQVLKND